jgi:hypothetical protein
MRWAFHGLTIDGQSNDPDLQARWWASFNSRPMSAAAPDITCALEVLASAPEPPARAPRFRQGALLEYYVEGDSVIAHFPRFGQLRLDLARGLTEGRLARAALDTYGVLEDLIAISLSPHLRRRGLFLIHAFAAALPHPRPGLRPSRWERGVLIVGDIGAGKTTTGMALLNAGWKLLSNDSPVIQNTDVLSYPGLLAAYPDSFARFPAIEHLAAVQPSAEGRKKITVAAEEIWPEVWIERAPVAAILFPQIEPRADHALEPLRPPEALRMLLPHAIEQWDQAMIPEHLALLSQLVQAAPTYRLRLAPDVLAIPAVLEEAISHSLPLPGLCG